MIHTEKKKQIITVTAIALALIIIASIALLSSHTIRHKLIIQAEVMSECVPVLAYHGFTTSDAKQTDFSDNKWIDSIDRFDQQMKYLYDNGWTTLTSDEFYQWHEGNMDIPEKTCMITFDDGYYDMYYEVLPILEKYNFSATSYIIGSSTPQTTEAFDPHKRASIGWDKINEIRSIYPKLEFQSHSYNLHGFDENGNEPWKTASLDTLTNDFNQNNQYGFEYMAYPYGGYNDTMLEAVKESNIKMAFAFKTPGYATKWCNKYKVPRQKITAETSYNDFKKIMEKAI